MVPFGDAHLFCADALNMLLVPAAPGPAVVKVRGPIRLDEFSAPQPDVVLLRPREGHYADSARPEDVLLIEDALLIIEVADSSLEYDRGKGSILRSRGHPGVVDCQPEHEEVEVRANPVGNEYATARTTPASGAISLLTFPDVTLQLREFVPPTNR